MDYVQMIVLYRVSIVIGGILCIYFGYKLFYIAKEKQGDFKIKTGGSTEVSVSDVAPGVFFALFGAGILVFSITNGISVDSKTTSPAPTGTSPGLASAVPVPHSTQPDTNITEEQDIEEGFPPPPPPPPFEEELTVHGIGGPDSKPDVHNIKRLIISPF